MKLLLGFMALLILSALVALAWRYRAWLLEHMEVLAGGAVLIMGGIVWLLVESWRPVPKRREEHAPNPFDEATRKKVRDDIARKQAETEKAREEVAEVAAAETPDERSEMLQAMARGERPAPLRQVERPKVVPPPPDVTPAAPRKRR